MRVASEGTNPFARDEYFPRWRCMIVERIALTITSPSNGIPWRILYPMLESMWYIIAAKTDEPCMRSNCFRAHRKKKIWYQAKECNIRKIPRKRMHQFTRRGKNAIRIRLPLTLRHLVRAKLWFQHPIWEKRTRNNNTRKKKSYTKIYNYNCSSQRNPRHANTKKKNVCENVKQWVQTLPKQPRREEKKNSSEARNSVRDRERAQNTKQTTNEFPIYKNILCILMYEIIKRILCILLRDLYISGYHASVVHVLVCGLCERYESEIIARCIRYIDDEKNWMTKTMRGQRATSEIEDDTKELIQKKNRRKLETFRSRFFFFFRFFSLHLLVDVELLAMRQ